MRNECLRKINLQPTLSGKLVLLRPLRTDEFEALYAVAADPLIWEQHPQRERYQKEVFEKYFASAIESRGAFAVMDQKTQQIIGSSRYYDWNAETQEIAIGYTFLARSICRASDFSYWRKQYALT